jgi:tRNA pseudouridine38-40 synthase
MRICLNVAYNGTAYAGWQVQPRAQTIQGALERVVLHTTGTETRVTGAGRTDAGVHAMGQVCHFDAPEACAAREPCEWQRQFNALLPPDIRVLAASAVSYEFHARYGAVRKTYRYQIDNHPVASPFLAAFAWHRPRLQHVMRMTEATALLLGELDQRIFATHPDGDRPIRPIARCDIEEDRLITVTVTGRSFLRHAVRGMVGALVEVGSGQRSLQQMQTLLESDPSGPRAVKAPAHGLCLAKVEY